MTERLVQWDSMDLRLAGSKIQTAARSALSRPDAPLKDLELEFTSGEIRLSGRIRRGVAVPFRVIVRRIEASGRTVVIRIEQMSAFGFLPVPALLTRLIGDRRAAAGILFEARSNSVVIQLDRFLPSFLDVEVDEIRIIDGGLLVRLGRGGADLPSGPGGKPWAAVET